MLGLSVSSEIVMCPKALWLRTSTITPSRDRRGYLSLRKPILTVTEDFKEPRRVMIAFDGGTITRRGVEMAAESPLFRGLPICLLMSGKETQDAIKKSLIGPKPPWRPRASTSPPR